MKRLLITTTNKPVDQSRMLGKLLNQVIPDSAYITRGKRNISQIISYAIENGFVQILIIGSREGYVDQINFYDRIGDTFDHNPLFIKIYEFIDPKIFNQSKIIFHGPLSTSLETRAENPELIDLLGKYFKLQFSEKSKLWMMLDDKTKYSYIQMIDATNMRRFALLKLSVKKRTR